MIRDQTNLLYVLKQLDANKACRHVEFSRTLTLSWNLNPSDRLQFVSFAQISRHLYGKHLFLGINPEACKH
jgi:hypothetical protein